MAIRSRARSSSSWRSVRGKLTCSALGWFQTFSCLFYIVIWCCFKELKEVRNGVRVTWFKVEVTRHFARPPPENALFVLTTVKIDGINCLLHLSLTKVWCRLAAAKQFGSSRNSLGWFRLFCIAIRFNCVRNTQQISINSILWLHNVNCGY